MSETDESTEPDGEAGPNDAVTEPKAAAGVAGRGEDGGAEAGTGAEAGAAAGVAGRGEAATEAEAEVSTGAGGAVGIRLEGVAKRFKGGVEAIRDITLDVEPGEFLVLVGPSGCGKSTLLRLLAGLEEVSDGRVLIGDADVTTQLPQQRDVAMVFQSYALYPRMSVRRNLAFGLRMRRINKAERARRVQEVAEVLGLDHLLDRRPAALSGGQRQRVAMGRAIVREPRVFLMDEPLSNLDAKLRVTMRAQLSLLHQRLGVTTVYVTHDQVEAMTLGQRVAVLRDGTLQQCDTPQVLYRNPVNLFVAAFIGSPSMNFVHATVEGGAVRFAGTAVPLPAGSPLATADREVILGIRPTGFTLEASGSGSGSGGAAALADDADGDDGVAAADAPTSPGTGGAGGAAKVGTGAAGGAAEAGAGGAGGAAAGAADRGGRAAGTATDAGSAEGGSPVIEAVPDVIEELGDERYVVFDVDAPRVDTEATRAAVDARVADDTLLVPVDRARFTVRLPTDVPLSPGEPLRLAINPDRLYFFDPDTGATLT